MKEINLNIFKENTDEILKEIIMNNEQLKISTKDGSVVVLSEFEYNSMIETIYINSIPKLRDELLEGKEISFEDCIPIEEVEF